MIQHQEVTKIFITAADDKLKVVWNSTDGDFDAYFIHKQQMLDRAAEIRDLLADLVKYGRQRAGKGCTPDTDIYANAGNILHQIAAKGYSLYQGLFLNAGGSVAKPAKVRSWLENSKKPRRIEFRIFNPIHIPWGLLFGHDPGPDPPAVNPADISHCEDFWAVRYNVSAVYFRIEATSISQAWPVNHFKVLAVRNKAAFEAALEKLKDPVYGDPGLVKVLEQFDQKSAKVLYSKAELLQQWSDLSARVGLLHFYCHADQKTLALGEDSSERITVNDFLETLQRTDAETPCLVFLNGCSTAVGVPESGFLTATGTDGYVGFIGTETKVPTVFALRFGLAFLYLFMCKGLNIGETMAQLRRDHWPLSLVYGPYCPPTFQVTPSDDFQIDSFPAGNFGRAALGDGLL